MIIDFDLIHVTAVRPDEVVLTCTLCSGQLKTKTDQATPTTLGTLVEAMADHLARNHGPEQSS